MANQDYYQKYLNQIVGGLMPSMKKQQSGMYDYLLQLGQRQGIGSAMQRAAQGVAPYAQAAGDAAAKEAANASRMAQQQEQFDTKQAAWEKQFQTGKQQWERAFEQRNKDQELANMMAMFEHTGWTPDLLDALGYSGLDRRRLEMFNRRENPFGLSSMGSGGGGGGAGTRYLGDTPYTVGRNHPLYRA